MEPTLARSLSTQLQISLDYVVREYYEMGLLKELYDSVYAARFVFKGGTALRLVYQSPRFSEDLDFDVIDSVDPTAFFAFLKAVGKHFPAINAVETTDKFNTLFALFRIHDPVLGRPFSIKFEASKRNTSKQDSIAFSDQIVRSPVTPLTILARVATREQILREKADALKNRKAARDVFDYWYMHQLNHEEITPDTIGFDREDALAELHKLLPRPYWRVIETWFASDPQLSN